MGSGQWFFKFLMRVEAKTDIGNMIKINQEIKMPLFLVFCKKDAKRLAEDFVNKIETAIKTKDKNFFKSYYRDIEYEDVISFSEFSVCFEESLNVQKRFYW
ncbi:hypothetical protein KAI92_04015 [Candidatus Parcubacteria bacterium]|nr:hypothetical protein [Candidatus Parcubacteria bacterium]